MTDQGAKDPNGDPEFATHLHDESIATPDATAPSLDAPNLATPGPATMQDMQRSLVDRIADVDDERRRSSTQLRKALQTHKDDVEQRLAAYRNALFGLSALAGLLIAGMIGLGFALHAQQAQVARSIVDRATAAPPTDIASRPASEELATRVAEIDRRLARLTSQLGDVDPATLIGSIDALSSQVEVLEANLRSLSEPHAAIADTPSVATSAGVVAEPSAETLPAMDVGRDDLPDALTSISAASLEATQDTPMQADAADIEVEQRRLEAEIAATRGEHISSQSAVSLPVDQLIDDQLERLEREYQRLARQLEAPAVQSSDAQTSASAGLAGGGRFALSTNEPIRTVDDSSTPDGGGADTAATMTTQEPRIALQLIGLRSRDEVRAFIAEHDLSAPLYLRSETYRGRPWYALISSLHDDMESATAARDALPADLARLDIWLRELPAGTELERIAPSADNGAVLTAHGSD